jgi:catechol 2,3-dioxygenase-like lactoylglutathione lyase family enzyme
MAMPKQPKELRLGSSKSSRSAAKSKPRAPRPAAQAKSTAAKARPAAPTKVRASAKTTGTKARAAKPAPPPPAPAAQAHAAPRRERRRKVPEALRLRALSAALTVGDLERSIHFYVEALGFSVKERWERDGRLMGVLLLAGTCELGLSQDDWAKGRDRVKGVGVRLYAETAQSLEVIATRAREHGIAVQGPKTSWGVRMVEVEDPDGFKLTIQWAR